MPLARLFVILNPRSGGGNAARAWEAVRGVLDGAGVAHALAETRGRGDATSLAEAAAREGWPAVLVLGGDGTVHEAANGLLRATDDDAPTVAMGIVPVGSGNDYAALLGIPRSPGGATRRALSAAPRLLDVGRVNGRWFVNAMGVGLDARVAIEANRVRRLRGMGMYLWALARVLPRFRPPRMRVELDGETIDRPLTLVAIANGARVGGGFHISPQARLDDGVLDLCACDALGTLGILGFLPRVMRGTHVGSACVTMRQVRRVRITSAEPLPVHVDGEILSEDARELEVEVEPGRLRVLA